MRYTILRLPEVLRLSGLSRSTLYLRISKGLWTRPVSLGGRSVGWPSHEVDRLNAARVAGLGDEIIANLVTDLEQERVVRFNDMVTVQG